MKEFKIDIVVLLFVKGDVVVELVKLVVDVVWLDCVVLIDELVILKTNVVDGIVVFVVEDEIRKGVVVLLFVEGNVLVELVKLIVDVVIIDELVLFKTNVVDGMELLVLEDEVEAVEWAV